ncbi:MAG: HAD family hydrolase, partial [Ruminococcus sp.]|nr:HAD family hydrolase [Candidatus Copronaster equi]
YIVSNCQEGYIDNFLDYHKLRKYFVDYECAGTKDCSKGELIKLVLSRNNFKSSIYVGDTQGDRNAAKEAEIPFIFAAYGFGQVDSTDFTINKFSDMVNFVR